MSLDLDPIRARLALDDDFRFLARAREDIAALLEEVERLRAEMETLCLEIAPWQTLAEKLGRQNDNMLSEVARLSRDHVATHEENASLDANLKDCVNFMRDLWPVIGVDLNALRLETDRAAAIETVRRAVQTRASVSDEVERLRSEVAQLRIFRCHVCDYPMRLVEDGDADDDGYLYACTRPGCHEECLCSTRQVTA